MTLRMVGMRGEAKYIYMSDVDGWIRRTDQNVRQEYNISSPSRSKLVADLKSQKRYRQSSANV